MVSVIVFASNHAIIGQGEFQMRQQTLSCAQQNNVNTIPNIIESFTGIRFIMIMVIVVSHFIFFKHNELSTFYSKHIRNPNLAVDFFFMLSGFGMMLSKKHRQEKVTISSSMKYAINHVKKIYPIFLATILFGLLDRKSVV